MDLSLEIHIDIFTKNNNKKTLKCREGGFIRRRGVIIIVKVLKCLKKDTEQKFQVFSFFIFKNNYEKN